METDRLDAKGPSLHLEQLQIQVDMQKQEPTTHDERLLNQKRPFTPYLIAFAGVVGFVPWMVNFDGGFSGVVLAMPSFNNAFGSECKDTPTGKNCMLTATEQSLSAIPYLFQAVGGALAGILGAYVGRRVAINIGCLVVIVGAAVMIGIDSYAKYVENIIFVLKNIMLTAAGRFLVGKCISGVGLGLLLGVGIVYGTECVPASQRGALLSVYSESGHQVTLAVLHC